ncbi:hypothetical protein P3T22_002510 [Paraburkholderia sp. GAS348]
MRLIFVDLAALVNPCSLHRAVPPEGRTPPLATRVIQMD